MEEFINPIIEWLGETHGSRDTYGWIAAVGIIVSIVGSIEAATYTEKKKKLRAEKSKVAEDKKLSATIVTFSENQPMRQVAIISREKSFFIVTVKTLADSQPEEKVSNPLSSIDEVEEYLLKNTKFILADFK
ncbi:hypothetical protein ACLUEY_17695 [Vreelandella aquamarina]